MVVMYKDAQDTAFKVLSQSENARGVLELEGFWIRLDNTGSFKVLIDKPTVLEIKSKEWHNWINVTEKLQIASG